MPAPVTTLVDRPSDATLFVRPQGPVSTASFLAEAHRFAAGLPDGRWVVNLCRDRYAFAVAFAGALLAGRTSLLNVDPSALAAVADRFADSVVATDETVLATITVSSGTVENPSIPPDHLAAVVFTSGSTGAPVAHEKRWGALVDRSRAAAEAFRLTGGTIVGTVPPQHMYGFETTVLLPLHAPVASWCGPVFYPADIAAALAACAAPRILVTTPLQLRAQLRAMTQGVAVPPLAAVVSATAPLDTALAAAAEAALGAPVLEIFGATEVGSIAHRRTTDGPVWTCYPRVALAIGEDGTVVRAPHAEPTPLADVVEAAPGGFSLVGRRADLIKLGGRRASLSGLNHALTGLPGVEDGAFVAPDTQDARLVAIVVAPAREPPAILADLRGVIDPVFLPRRVIRVDAMPRDALGKLPRQALLDLLARADAA